MQREELVLGARAPSCLNKVAGERKEGMVQ